MLHIKPNRKPTLPVTLPVTLPYYCTFFEKSQQVSTENQPDDFNYDNKNTSPSNISGARCFQAVDFEGRIGKVFSISAFLDSPSC
jgi:hypothetical protein